MSEINNIALQEVQKNVPAECEVKMTKSYHGIDRLEIDVKTMSHTARLRLCHELENLHPVEWSAWPIGDKVLVEEKGK